MRTGGQISEKSSRIARNTALLYFRMFLLMIIGLYTSRVVLKALGVDNFGIWNAVGGIVAMFAIVSGSVTGAISRYISYSLGKGDEARLRRIFSTSIIIQIILGVLIILLGETFGLWFLREKMSIPEGRMGAADVVLQCSLAIMVVNLIAVPYNADIIAHEQMKAFAYVSVIEASLKLGVALLLAVSPADKLKTYALLMVAVALTVRFMYSLYCRRHFQESRGRLVFDRSLLKEMAGFAGWNFFGSTAYLFNTQGINILSNIFFGVGVNAARGVAAKVEGTVMQFVTNFTTALNPQITKSFAENNHDYCFHLVCRGAKYTWLLLLFFALPVWFEGETLIRLWLGNVPEGAVLFTRLSILAIMADMLGNSLAILELATGDIKKYYLIIGSVSFLVFPISWILFKLGMPAHASYYVFTAVYLVLVPLKLIILRGQTGFPIPLYLKDVILPAFSVAGASFALVWALRLVLPCSPWNTLITILACIVATAAFSWLFAMTRGEKDYLLSKLRIK